MIKWFIGASLLLSAVIFLLTLYHSKNQKHLGWMALYLFGVMTWVGGCFWLINMPVDVVLNKDDLAFIPAYTLFASGLIVFGAQYVFFKVYRNYNVQWNLYEILMIFLTAVGVGAIIFDPDMVITYVTNKGNYFDTGDGYLKSVVALFLLLIFISTICLIFNRHKNESNLVLKQQFKYFGGENILFLLLTLTTNVILVNIFNIQQFNALGPCLYSLEALVFYYVVFRYRFLNLSCFFSETLAFTFTLGIVFLVAFPVSIFLISNGAWLGLVALNCFFLATFLFAGNRLFPFVHGLLRWLKIKNKYYPLKSIEKKTKYWLENGFDELEILMGVSHVRYATVSSEAFNSVQESFSLYQKDKALVTSEIPLLSLEDQSDSLYNELLDQHIELIVLVEGEDGILGYLLFDSKLNGQVFFQQEIDSVKSVANNIGQLLSNSKTQVELVRTLDQKSLIRKQFLNDLMHEIQHSSLLIRNYSAMIDTSNLDEKSINSVKYVQESAEELDDKLHRVLQAFQWQNQMLDIHLSSVTMAFFWDLVMAEMKQAFPDIENMITLKAKPSDLKQLFVCDCMHLVMAVCEVLENAFFYNDNVDPRVIIELESTDRFWTIDVLDNGTGIPEAEWCSVFWMLKVMAFSRSSSEAGLGVGLTIVRGIIEAHQGQVKIIKSNAYGTTLRFKIPRLNFLFRKDMIPFDIKNEKKRR